MPLGRHQHRQLLPREEDDLRVDQGAHAKAPAECELHLGIAVSGRDIELVCVSFGGNASLRMMRSTDIGILRTAGCGPELARFKRRPGPAGRAAHHRQRIRAAPREQHAVGVDDRARVYRRLS